MLVRVLTSRHAATRQHTILGMHSLLLGIESGARQICRLMQCIHVVILLLDQHVFLRPLPGTGQDHTSASMMPICCTPVHPFTADLHFWHSED